MSVSISLLVCSSWPLCYAGVTSVVTHSNVGGVCLGRRVRQNCDWVGHSDRATTRPQPT